MYKFILLAILSLLIAGCGGRASTGTDANASANAKRYPIQGKIVSVDRAAKKATIDHKDIPGFMDAMTMEFPIRADWAWDELKPGAEIHGELVVDNAAKDPYWIENVAIVAAPDPNQPAPPVNERFAQLGREAPDFTLTNQNGQKISLRDFRGKAVAITFIYRECPLPEYCIKMSRNFSDLANQLKDDAALKDRVRLLSISFDPGRDTPEKLKQYGAGYLGQNSKPDFTIWQLAVGPDAEVRKIADFYGLRYEVDQNDKAQFNHSLRTIVIDPAGKVAAVFSGNDWTNADLMREIKAALEAGAKPAAG
ncbi:MAG: SCO family protein [Pyrinomonadaceae bacterium]